MASEPIGAAPGRPTPARGNWGLLRLGFAAGALASGAASAQSPVSPLIIDKLKGDRGQPVRPLAPLKAKPPAARIEAAEQAGTTLRGIRFEGGPVPAKVAASVQPFVGRPASRANLDAIAAAMAEAYGQSDVGLYTVLIPDQDLTAGVLRVVVAEGFIEDTRVGAGAGPRVARRLAATVAPLRREKPLTRATLERDLSLVRDIPGLETKIDLLPGATPAGVIVALEPKRNRPKFTSGFSNQPASLLGSGQFDAGMTLYGLGGVDAATELSLAASTDLRRFRYAALGHGVGLDAAGTRLSLSAAHLTTRPKGAGKGKATLIGGSVAHPLIRSYRRNLSLSFGLDGLNSDSAVIGGLVATERTRAARLGANYSANGEKRSLALSLSASQGLDLLGARTAATLADKSFRKLSGTAGLDRALGRSAALRLRAAGQYSADALPAAERLAVGGAEYGRAFDTALLSGDRGYAGSAELAARPLDVAAFAASEAYVFVDGARIHVNARGPFAGDGFGLASSGGGFRLAYTTKASLSLEAARAIDRPFAAADKWRINIGWRLSLR